MEFLDYVFIRFFKCHFKKRKKSRFLFKKRKNVFSKYGVCVREVAPTIEDDEPEVAVTVGSRAVLVCDADGLPKPDITWMKDGTELATTSGSQYTVQRTGSLQLSEVTVNDSGLYECIATNDAGTARRQVVLSVQGNLHQTYTRGVIL